MLSFTFLKVACHSKLFGDGFLEEISYTYNRLLLKIIFQGSLANLMNPVVSSQEWLYSKLNIILLLITMRIKALLYL